MSWGTAEPPINPPEPDLQECDHCKGTGEAVHHDGPLGPLVAVVKWCNECGGHGVHEVAGDLDQGQPDHWKDVLST